VTFFPALDVLTVTTLFDFLPVITMHAAFELADAFTESAGEFGYPTSAEENDDYEEYNKSFRKTDARHF
jgi:hypothetical protein